MTIERRWKPELPNIKGADLIGIDIETYDPDLKELGSGVRRDGYMVGFSIAIKRDGEYKAWYVPIRHEVGTNIEPEIALQWCKDNLCSDGVDKVFTNALYDLDYFYEEGVFIDGKFHDILNSEPLLDEYQHKFGLEYQAQKYLGYGKDESELENYVRQIIGPKANVKGSIWKLPGRIIKKYAEQDAIQPLMIYEKQQIELEKQDLLGIYNLETRLVPMLLHMKRVGVRVNIERAFTLELEYKEQIKKDYKRLKEIAGYNVNYRASESIAEYCDTEGIEYSITKKSKKPSITKTWMERQEGEFFELCLKLRQDDRLSNAFIENLIMKYQINERIHCQFNQLKGDSTGVLTGTVSGRLSSSLPNLQQIPSPDKTLGPVIRKLFIPEEDHEWVCLDLRQIEPKISLHYSTGRIAEETKKRLWENPDIDSYSDMVAELRKFDININKKILESDKLFRKLSKTCFLGISYSMGINAICQRLGVDYKEGVNIINIFNNSVPYIKKLNDRVKKIAETRGYIKTILGRKSRFNTFEPRGMYGKNRNDFPALPYNQAVLEYGHNIQRAYCYKSMNRLIQGSSADILKKAMINIWESGICSEAIPHLSVHDEMDFSVLKNERGKEIKKELVYMMENVVPELTVPLKTDLETGPNWGELIKEK